MGKVWPTVVRDPIHNIMTFRDNDLDRLLLSLINTPEFQRLRRIKQLGMTDLVFPGASHTRFAHSIGVMWVVKKFIEAVELRFGDVDDEYKNATIIAGLLHDIGHGPFSHAFERTTNENHEKWTERIILSQETLINRILVGFDSALPAKVASFFNNQDCGIPKYFKDMVSSQLDADRFDYLIRDSHATGTVYGHFDYDWLLQHLLVDEDKQRLYLGKKALSAGEAYLFARFHMYQSVYYHKTTRAAELMLELLFKRFGELVKNDEDYVKKILPNLSEALVDSFSGRLKLSSYMYMDDVVITVFLKNCMLTEDPVLRLLSNGLINRNLYKCTDASGFEGMEIGEFTVKVQDIIEKHGMIEYYHFAYDTAADVPYKPYNPDKEVQETQIFIENNYGNQVEICSLAPALEGLRKKYSYLRYYYPAETREAIASMAETCFKGEAIS